MNNTLCGKAVIAALLASSLLAAPAVQADPLVFDDQGNAVFGATHDTAGTYEDEFVFSVDGEDHHYASGSLVPGYSFLNNTLSTNYEILEVQIFSQNSNSSRTYLPTQFPWAESPLLFYPFNRLTPGNYGFIITGRTTNPDAGGSFAGNFNITPVPEPATYGMLLAGMALLGVAARTRKT